MLEPSPAGRVTAATDLALATCSLVALAIVSTSSNPVGRPRGIWSLVFLGAALAASLDAASNGTSVSGPARELISRVLHLLVALVAALLVAGVAGDRWSPAIAKRIAPFLCGLAVLFTPVLHRTPGDSSLRIGIGTVVLGGALAVYTRLAWLGRRGARLMTLGVLLVALGAAFGAARARAAAAMGGLDLDAPGHLAESAGVLVLAIGNRSSFESDGT